MAKRPARPPVRPAPPSASSAVATRLTTPPATWPRDLVLTLLSTIVVAGVLVILDRPLLASSCAALGTLIAVVLAVHGRVQAARAETRDRLVEALVLPLRAPVLDRGTVRLRGWPRGKALAPERARVTYSPAAEDDSVNWIEAVIAVVDRRLLAHYEVRNHDRSRCHLDLALTAPSADTPDARPAVQRRADEVAAAVLGETATVEDTHWSPDGDLTQFTIRHHAGVKVAARGAQLRIERVIATMLPGRWRARWDPEHDEVRFEVRPTLPTAIPHPPPAPNASPDRLPLARGEDDQVIEWNLRGTAPHAMFCGKTGTGKTVAIMGVVTEAAVRGHAVWIVDGKRVEFLGLRGWPNVQIVATDIRDQVALIYKAWQLMEDRYLQIETGQADESDFEPLILVLDEHRDFVANATEWYASIKVPGMPAKCPVFDKVGSLARKARTARIHLLMGTQRPDAEWLGGEALATDTPIPTPDGWTTMGEVTAGQLVLGENGRPVKVTAATEVAVGRPCYRVTFSDGSTLVTDGSHLWLARSAVQRWGDLREVGNKSRLQRWPLHSVLRERLDRLDAADPRHTTVSQFETHVGHGRIALLRRGIHDGRLGLEVTGSQHGAKGRFDARTYRFGNIVSALRAELASPAPTWRNTRPQLVTTAQMADSLRCGTSANWSVQVAQPVDLPEADLPIDPWLLGYWLGDGHKAAATIATADEEVLQRIRQLGYRLAHYARFNYGISTGGPRSLKSDLRQLGLLHNKHLPPRYLRASITQRAELLAGLLDSDGTCAVRNRGSVLSGQVSFSNVDRGLIDGVAELAASLGFVPTVSSIRPAGIETHRSSVAYGCATRQAWKVMFTPDRQVFGIARKQRVLEPALTSPRRATTRQRYVVGVDPVRSVPVRCITVDSSTHLYLAGRTFIPTHNCRDNFATRMSLGRLSPQGAMMMWESYSTGVSVPARIPGRGTAAGDDAAPVEAHAYWTPDPRKAIKSNNAADLAILQSLRPSASAHPYLEVQITEPDPEKYVDDKDDKRLSLAQWHAVLAARLVEVLAPPLVVSGTQPLHTADVRGVLSSPIPTSGTVWRRPASHAGAGDLITEPRTSHMPATPEPATPPHRPVALALIVGGGGSTTGDRPAEPAPADDDDDDGAGDVDVDVDQDFAYGPATPTRAERLQPGDLIYLEDEASWVAVEAAETDVVDETNVCVDWRSDDDASGSLSLPADAHLPTRHPLEEH